MSGGEFAVLAYVAGFAPSWLVAIRFMAWSEVRGLGAHQNLNWGEVFGPSTLIALFWPISALIFGGIALTHMRLWAWFTLELKRFALGNRGQAALEEKTGERL